MRRTTIVMSAAAAALVAVLALIARDTRDVDEPAPAAAPAPPHRLAARRGVVHEMPAVTADGVVLPGSELPAWSPVLESAPTPPAPEHPVPPPVPPEVAATFVTR